MSTTGKYSREERRIAIKIYDLVRQQTAYYQKWQDLDMRISILKRKLNGKYGGWKNEGNNKRRKKV